MRGKDKSRFYIILTLVIKNYALFDIFCLIFNFIIIITIINFIYFSYLLSNMKKNNVKSTW